MSLMLLAPLSWAGRIWALPFFSAFRHSEQKGRRHKTLLDWARQMAGQLHRWLPERTLILVCDSSCFAALEWLGAVRPHATVITPLRLDADLYEPAFPKETRHNGTSPQEGEAHAHAEPGACR